MLSNAYITWQFVFKENQNIDVEVNGTEAGSCNSVGN